MAILHVAGLGQPVLRQKASRVSPEEIPKPGFQRFLDDLVESMRFHQGVGLAAPQVFRPQRVVAVEVPPNTDQGDDGLGPVVLVNPELRPEGSEMEEDWEGCLSLRDLRGRVPRYRAVTLRALDRTGEPVEWKLAGFPARVLQHEVDHLDGIVFPDRMRDLTTLVFAGELGQPDAEEKPGGGR